FSRGEFPTIGDQAYPLTLGPHGFYWFALQPAHPSKRSQALSGGPAELPLFSRVETWEQLVQNSNKDRLEALLPEFLARRRMATGTAHIRAATVLEMLDGSMESIDVRLLILRLDYQEADPETILLPLARVPENRTGDLIEPVQAAGIVRLPGSPLSIVCDAITHSVYC